MMMMMIQRGPLYHHHHPFAQIQPVIYHHRPIAVPLYHRPSPPQFQSGFPPFTVVGGPIYRQESVKRADRVEVRRVCRYNLKAELALIESLIRRGYRFASMDTEFPGTVVPSKIERHLISQALPVHVYEMMKDNVDRTHIIQLGLALSDPCGNLPLHDGAYCCWEFNFSDFDVNCDQHLRNSDSIDLLKRQGIDFSENKETGICYAEFAEEIERSGLVKLLPCLTWATFQSAYDFGFLTKILTGKKKLPEDIKEFMGNVKTYFGPNVYDIKYMMKYCDGLFGGLDRVAETLGVSRVAGSSHQAGSDSLLTLQTFVKLLKMEKNKGKDKENYENYCKLCEECREGPAWFRKLRFLASLLIHALVFMLL